MRIFNIRSGSQKEDIEKAQQFINAEIAHPAKNVVIIWGDTPEVDAFADLVAARCDNFPNREAILIRNTDIFNDVQKTAWLKGHDDANAVIIDLDDQPTEWLSVDASLRTIEKALLRAGI